MKTKTIPASFAFALGALLAASAVAQTGSAPPPSAPAQRSAADLDKLVAPIALYPDPLVATILPASVYPLEIVKAARFVKDTNNIAKIDEQSWDDNVKAVARVPEVISMMNDDLDWTTSLGQAFLDQQSDVMTAIQNMRGKAEKAGTLKTTPQQVVIVTNTIIERTVEQQVVIVTNTVVQIVPSNPQIIYVPTYNPYTVYYPPPGPPPIVTFAAGVAVGLIIANNCDWHGGGIYVGPHGMAVWGGGGGYHNDVDIDINRNVNINNNNVNINNRPGQGGQGQKWQPDQSRLRNAGAPGAVKSMEARGWGSGNTTATRPAAATGVGNKTSTWTPSTTRPATPTTPSANHPTATPGISKPTAPNQSINRPSTTPSPSINRPAAAPSQSINRPAQSGNWQGSAFGGTGNGAATRNFSSRGNASRGGGGRGASRGGRR